MAFDPAKHHRRSIRLRGYDYGQRGAYFVTTCVHDRQSLCGKVTGDQVELTAVGKIVRDTWEAMSSRFPDVELVS